MQQRESRREVVIPAQMRGKGDWSDVTIRNISPHGMMLLAPFPPKPGTYVEIRKASLALIGRVVWVKGKALGIQLIERLNFNALLRAANESWAASHCHGAHATESLGVAPPEGARHASGKGRSDMLAWIVAGIFLALATVCASLEMLQLQG